MLNLVVGIVPNIVSVTISVFFLLSTFLNPLYAEVVVGEDSPSLCRPLDVDESASVDIKQPAFTLKNQVTGRLFSFKPEDVKYQVTRTSESSWNLNFNFKFVAAGDYNGEFSSIANGTEKNKLIHDEYSKRFRGCFEKYNRAEVLKDSFGRKITLSLGNSIDVANEISITRRGILSNSRRMAADITCLYVVHETLHYTGLTDQYKADPLSLFSTSPNLRVSTAELTSSGLGEKLMFDCRKFPDIPSIMDVAKLSANGPVPLLLNSAQVNFMIYPGCNTRGEYRTCILNGNRTSRASGGRGCYKTEVDCGSGEWLNDVSL